MAQLGNKHAWDIIVYISAHPFRTSQTPVGSRDRVHKYISESANPLVDQLGQSDTQSIW
jgi:hypothetical protein